MWFLCSVGSVFFCGPRAAWKCQFCFLKHLCGDNAWKNCFLNKNPNYSLTFLLFADHGRGMLRHFFWFVAKIRFLPCVGIAFWILMFSRWIIALWKAWHDLQKCASCLAWGSRFGFHCLIWLLLSCREVAFVSRNELPVLICLFMRLYGWFANVFFLCLASFRF